ncbi:unnamed protein product [Phytophthora lilii]|uniref:Unnamed protein product n=1 Tax=Phytophthora lilii TaxID=2077276 RepID=A0A9W6UDD9_9STRA|nr:unnamed protein product [Phytophthora lilii]
MVASLLGLSSSSKPHLVCLRFAERLGDVSSLSIKQIRKQLKPLLDRDITNPPLRFDALQIDVFGARLLTLEKPDGSALSYSTLNTHRAELCIVTMALKSRQQWRKDCRRTLRDLNEREQLLQHEERFEPRLARIIEPGDLPCPSNCYILGNINI